MARLTRRERINQRRYETQNDDGFYEAMPAAADNDYVYNRAEAPATRNAAVVPARTATDIASQVVSVITMIVEAILILRLLFRAGGANPSNGFVSFVYSLSRPLVAPFQSIFPQVSMSVARFEVATLIAMLVWGLVGLLVAMLLRSLSRSPENV